MTNSMQNNIPETLHGGDVWNLDCKTSAEKIVDFSSNVNPLGPPKSVSVAIRRCVNRISQYPDIEQRALREAIAKYVGLDRKNIVAGNGSTDLIYLASDVLMGRNGRKQTSKSVCIPVPTFAEYERAARRAGAGVVYSYADHNVRINLDDLMEKIPTNGMVFLCNPNNPNGQLWERNQIEHFVNNAQSRNCTVCVDEGFIEFVEQPNDFSLAMCVKKYHNLVVIRSLTKSFCIPGLRIGYILSSEETASKLAAAQPPWSVNCVAEVCAIAALDDSSAYLERTRKLVTREARYLEDELKKMDLLVIHSQANFLLVNIRKTNINGKELKKKLIERYGLLIRECSSFRGLDEFWIRVAVRGHGENVMLTNALRQLIQRREGIASNGG